MTLPPPPNPYGSQPGPSWGGQNPGGGQPPGFGGSPGGQPPWGPQPQWSGPSGPPPGRGGRGKWILGGLAVVLAIALAVVITVLVVRPDSGGGGSSPTSATGVASEFASAGDVGPVNIITEDPTCEAWNRAVDAASAVEGDMKWDDRIRDKPASEWTAQERAMYEAVSKAMNAAAAQTVELAKQTPHRVVRELYTQFSAYAKQFERSLTTFSGSNQWLPEVVDRIGSVLVDICAGISFKLAAAQAPYVPDGSPPSSVLPPSDPATAPVFLDSVDPVCKDWSSLFRNFDVSTVDWQAIDSNIPASQWSPEQRAINDAAADTMTKYADDLGKLAESSDNLVLRDFGELAAQYRRAYVHAIPSYAPGDNYLVNASTDLIRIINSGCKAVS